MALPHCTQWEYVKVWHLAYITGVFSFIVLNFEFVSLVVSISDSKQLKFNLAAEVGWDHSVFPSWEESIHKFHSPRAREH